MTTDNTDRHFKGQQRSEVVVYYTRKHWITQIYLFIEIIAFTLVFGALIFVAVYLKEVAHIGELMIAAVVAMTVWLHHIFTGFLNYFLGIIVITNFRVIILEKSIYIKDDKDVVDLHEIQDIKKIQHGIIPNLLNYGKLVVVVPTMIQPMIINAIGDPEKFFRKINNAKRDYIHERQQQRLKMLAGNNQTDYEVSRAT
ncbi:hypothetical protein COW94_04705 [Candidatus Peregrinibacteria bacterium CG22_combo_CG10-13_8_21_14_all_44_10]|nr:MAG: hypothetical protein AUK45_03075 [Candidatus Peregrinibacteria bacterium CG2_30_44_17]PIP65876.1 MAG: hypothetical protein COW94_04705 [Candidatus Peregrinibacteria bacterium CG22_combo_CG10-13_8_21_14_all_44_10]PIS04514.1 MAG: hypothetical protein COT83_00130 [Candidatus Peregrinibacteria bacterium CG10_big_fil_rev_8_21_14_0_10_44_7]